MAGFANWKSPVLVLILTALLSANPALADRATDLDARAAAEYNRGLDAHDAGQNAAACEHFRNSAVLYENSISALTSRYMGSEEARDAVKSAANQQQAAADAAKARAKEVCGRPDGPALTASSASSSSSDVDWNADKKTELQRTETLAKNQYAESVRLWEAGDRRGACATIRLSAANFASITTAMNASPALRASFANPDQLVANAAMVAEVRDDTFCKS